MMALNCVAALGLTALAGCATVAGTEGFQISADEVSAAWRRNLQLEEREAEQQGTYPPGLGGPYFSYARCHWVELSRKAFCRYRTSRGALRPGSEAHWVEESAEFYLLEEGWSFSG